MRVRSYRGRHRAADVGVGRPGADRLYEIDLLRIAAAIAVVVYHYTFSGWAGHLTSVTFPALSRATRYGYLGVDLFFTISGFVVLLSAWGRRPHQFVISRVVRLYPAYWVAVTVTAAIAVTCSRGRFTVSPLQYVANLTMLNALPNVANVDVVYWTLWAEIRFYLLVFVLAWIGITRRRVIVLLWLWLGATGIIESGLVPHSAATKLDLLVQSQWSHYFIAGMAMCLIFRSGWSWQLAVIFTLAFGNAEFRAIDFGRRVADRYHQTLHPQVIVAIVATILVVMLLVSLRVTRRIGRPWFAVVGALTYPLYLIHAYNGFVVFERLGRILDKWVLLAATMLVMATGAAGIHHFVEVPVALRLKRGLQRLAKKAGIERPPDVPTQRVERMATPPSNRPDRGIDDSPTVRLPHAAVPIPGPAANTDTDTVTLSLPGNSRSSGR